MSELELLEKYFGSMPQAFCLLEILLDSNKIPYDFRFIYLNNAMAQLEGFPKEELTGSRFYQLFPKGDRKWMGFFYGAAFERKIYRLRRFYSPEIHKYLRISCYPWPGSSLCACLVTDETELVQAERNVHRTSTRLQTAKRDLREACHKAENAKAAKTGFLSSVSHDMRTPLNGILGYTNLALQAKHPELMREYLEKIQRSGKLLLELINNTLDLNQIETGAIALHPESISQQALLDDVVNAVQVSMDEKNIKFCVDSSGAFMTNICVDVLRMREVLINLLSNAIKFTPNEGRIDFIAETMEIDESYIYDRIIVRDSGCGISEEFLPRLFEPFTQERNRTSGNHVIGSGLGLSIVKRLVELMGGGIEVKSRIGEGTEFTLYLKSALAPADFEPEERKTVPPAQEVLKGKRILLCEDNEINREIAEAILEMQEMEVVTAENGQEGLRLFAESPPYGFAAVLMDEEMPVMDGFTAAEGIRGLLRPDADVVPILALTGNAYREAEDRAKAAGMDACLLKPFEPAELFEVLVQYIDAAERKKENKDGSDA